ncbi:hypothetical protein H5410_064471 [Solanum commersonii]|uniref:Uncharacterized protein n=1 Tax=Solanum commersonii TaxID=4109 RepID=A0A9J5VZA9_SOLCO|nr:hypothetical protein H5410_064471 [Solanum commersonii]
MDNEIQKLKTNEDNLKSKASISQQHDCKNAELCRSKDRKNPELKGTSQRVSEKHKNSNLNHRDIIQGNKTSDTSGKDRTNKNMIIPEDIEQQPEIQKSEIPSFYANKRIIGISTIIQELAK